MALYAIGDVQGCNAELGALLAAIGFSAERDRLWFVGDLVNRGPDSLGVLRRVRALGAAAVTTLGNHDLHLLALAHGVGRPRSDDTLGDVLEAPDRDALIDWLLEQPLLHEESGVEFMLLHAGLPPQWDRPTARRCAREFEHALRRDPARLFKTMYGDKPDRWDGTLEEIERLRFTVNCFTRLRYVDAQGRLALKAKGAPGNGAPGKASSAGLIPWFAAPNARWRGNPIVFGHWSTLGYFRTAEVIGLDTGCVWGGSLTALRLDGDGSADTDGKPVQIGCAVSAEITE
jgi:bis(5'-nucleosyl)-tetraphosphatase (symmetrical)